MTLELGVFLAILVIYVLTSRCRDVEPPDAVACAFSQPCDDVRGQGLMSSY